MEMIINSESSVGLLSARPAEDLAGEGMWRIAVGESCHECWDELTEDQRDWWRSCASFAIREWLGAPRPPR
jgi:hypothetical protein